MISNSTDILYRVKHNNSRVFMKDQILKYVCCTYSGKCYLLADINDNLKREWLMYYDVEEIKN